MTFWCAVKTHANAEERASFHLRRQGFIVYFPKCLRRRSHARRVDWIARPFFPGYLFVKVDPDSSPWRSIRSTVGVFDLVRSGSRPTPVPETVIDEIRAREDEKGLIKTHKEKSFSVGEAVIIASGALGEIDALFVDSDDQHRVTLLLSLLGRRVRATVDKDAVFAAI